MSRKPALLAAGAIVLRAGEEGPEVLAVHRPHHDDWSLPKGRPEPDEDLPVVAVRAVLEETGVRVRLTHPLGTLRYKVDGKSKTVHWWRGIPVGGSPHPKGTIPREDGQEVDRVRWLPLDDALELLTYPAEQALVLGCIGVEPGAVVVLVRHGKAMLRKHWSGKDWKRPLNSRGRRQSKRLVALLDAYGVRELVSSSSTRCIQTLQPYAKRANLPIVHVDALSEEAYEEDPVGSTEEMAQLATDCLLNPGEPTAFCGHRPVLPMMREQLGLDEATMLVAEAAVIHHDLDGNVIAVEKVKSAF